MHGGPIASQSELVFNSDPDLFLQVLSEHNGRLAGFPIKRR
jgi:hypothetical protein